MSFLGSVLKAAGMCLGCIIISKMSFGVRYAAAHCIAIATVLKMYVEMLEMIRDSDITKGGKRK